MYMLEVLRDSPSEVDELLEDSQFSLEATVRNESLIKNALEKHCGHLKFDAALVKKLERFIQNFINKSPEHVKCLGSNLTGVNRLTWTVTDRADWEDNIIQVDAKALRQEILAIPYIEEVGVVASDNFNISCCWMAHRFYLSNLPIRSKEYAMKLCMDILQYKLLSSIHTRYFQYPVNQNVAEATYEELSRKFDIKKYGNWRRVLDARSENIISSGEIHEQTIKLFNDDVAIVRMVQDIQYRLRDKIKNIWEVMARVIAEDKRFASTDSKVQLDDALVVRDIERLSSSYTAFIKSVSSEKNRFIKPDLVEVVMSLMGTMPERPFEKLLITFSERTAKNDKAPYRLLDLTMEHLFNIVLADRKTEMRIKDASAVLLRVKALYTASRGDNELLNEMKEIGEKMVRKDLGIVNLANVASLRTGLLLYIVLRTMVKEHYQ